jgi:hypothetical protein
LREIIPNLIEIVWLKHHNEITKYVFVQSISLLCSSLFEAAKGQFNSNIRKNGWQL